MKKYFRLLGIILMLSLFAINVIASDKSPENSDITKDKSAEALMAGMSDEQVRRLLIVELKKEAGQKPTIDSTGSLAGFIENIKNKVTRIQQRIEFLRSGGKSNIQQMSGLFAYLGKGEPDSLPTRSIFSILIIFAIAYVIELLFRWYSTPFRSRLESGTRIALLGKIGRLILRALIDMISTLIFIAVAILCFYFFFENTHALRILLATYLTAIVSVKIILIVTRFFLVPKDPGSRFLPIKDSIAWYFYRWITAISIVGSFGLLTCGIIRLSGSSEADHVKSVFMVALLIAVMLIVMILQKRKEVAETLSEKFPPESQRAKIMRQWHHFAVFIVFFLLILSTINILLGNSNYLSIKTLLLIPFYFIADWILRQSLEMLFGFIPESEDTIISKESQDESSAGDSVETPNQPMLKQVEFSRMKKIIVPTLRISLLVLFNIWALNIWGIELPIGKAVTKAVFNIMIVVLLCYVLWEFINTAIQRKLRLEMPDEDEGEGEGSAGGSRIGTLLTLLRKFLLVCILVIAVMIILSAMGVNIGPLIAGAGVVGLAIGFGAQALVRDIISGLFFLVDDAFRIGDYIEVGGSKGMVQHISLRSLKLRHPRIMVDTITFGDIATVKNYSRDYIITKLDFRVRYDTDIEKVRKLIKKKVYEPIRNNEELGPLLLDNIKSQGVRQLDDSAVVMRVKYKTKPGDQFMIRKEVYRLIMEVFREEGVEFAHKNVTVYMPPELSQESGAEGKNVSQKIAEAGAAAAALMDQEDKEKPAK